MVVLRRYLSLSLSTHYVGPRFHDTDIDSTRNAYEFLRWDMKPGDVIVFTEALIHGALPWTGTHERRMLIMRYGPGIMSFSPPAAADGNAEIAALSPLHEALLKPPSFPARTDFPALLEDLA